MFSRIQTNAKAGRKEYTLTLYCEEVIESHKSSSHTTIINLEGPILICRYLPFCLSITTTTINFSDLKFAAGTDCLL